MYLEKLQPKLILEIFACWFVVADAFDREYRLALTELNPKYMAQMMPFDRAPKRGVYTCRHYFSALDL